MKVSCEVIKDLLPLYIDDICSEESRQLIVEHLQTCETCKAELAAMKDDLPIDTYQQNLKEAQVVKKIAKKWKKGMLKSFVKGGIITLLILAIISIILFFVADLSLVFGK
ncbi:zf-HC2 domain-containing protein [Isobaculum melis]|uniref:Anti-sigma-W factor RsiW n=1 Tax=Isobaculum melis TaxID=142588 RepID=A0A1H9T081_9LACT|nr:zf-HC2 domain-containing protein [Isobaculum melis]SER90424.1 Putative zinc-finger [Isobaculum melis]